jgi:ectoine hydroxylase-related dioxygenase (phytanoyl-CoA dioxygenase family)
MSKVRLFSPQMVATTGEKFSREFLQWLGSFRNGALQLSEWTEDLGSTMVVAGSFTISDPEINEASRLLVIAAPDESNALEPIKVVGVTCAAGSAVVEWECDSGQGTGYDASGELVGHSLGGAHGTRSFFYGVSG